MIGSNYCQREGGTQIKTHPNQNLDSVFLESNKIIWIEAKLKSLYNVKLWDWLFSTRSPLYPSYC